MTTFSISTHAVEQYRSRVVLCCERQRTNAQLRAAMTRQIEQLPWHLAGGETFVVEAGPLRQRSRFHKRHGVWLVADVTHQFLIERSIVVTVLGFMMRTDRRKNRRKRRIRRRRQSFREYQQRSAPV